MGFNPETQDFDTYLQTAIQQGVAAAMAGQPASPATPAAPGAAPAVTQAPGGINLMVDGQSYTFASDEEASAAVQETLNQHRAANQTPASPATPAPDAKPTFDQTRYVDLMGRDPVEAARYIKPFTDSGDTDRVKAVEAKVRTQDHMLAAFQFKEAHPEFAFMNNGANIIESTLKANRWDLNTANLEAALALAQSRGQLPTRDQIQQQLSINAATQGQVATNAQAGAVLPPLPPPIPPQQPGQIPPQVPIQGAVAPQMPPVPVASAPVPQYTGPPQPTPGVNPSQVYPPVAVYPQAAMPPPGAVIPPPALGVPTAAGLPANWVDQADNLTTEQIEQIFRQQG